MLHFIKMYKNQVNVIKRGSKIVMLKYGSIAFVDAMNFGPNCSLDSFGKMWGAAVKKGCFPYEMYTTIEDMVKDDEWPAMPSFSTTLGRSSYSTSLQQIEECYQMMGRVIEITRLEFTAKLSKSSNSFAQLEKENFPVDVAVYSEMWAKFELSKKNGTMANMMDYLCYYNALDTEVLADAMSKYIRSFLNTFGINPNEHITLPSISERVLWNYYDNTMYQPYSFNEDFGDISQIIRSQLAGGLACVFARHVELGDGEQKYQYSVHHASNGQRFRHLVAYDVNSK